MKLQLLVPQYQETDETIKPLLDSLAIQKEVDLNEVGVVICNDESDVFLTEEFLKSYPFKIEYHKCEHRGVSATRNACMDYATAEYVMFCDADDMFYSVAGLWMIFREMKTGFDGFTSVFVEDTRTSDEHEPVFVYREKDSTFVHGKVWRLDYLRKHKLRFNEKLMIHEDSYFNVIAQNCTENLKYCPTPFYLWCWRDDSVCRHDMKYYLLKTYTNLLDSSEALVQEFMERGMREKATYSCVNMIFEAYYTMSKPDWINQDNVEYRDKTEKHFSRYFKKHKHFWQEISDETRMEISDMVRSKSIKDGMTMETMTISQWLEKIESLTEDEE